MVSRDKRSAPPRFLISCTLFRLGDTLQPTTSPPSIWVLVMRNRRSTIWIRLFRNDHLGLSLCPPSRGCNASRPVSFFSRLSGSFGCRRPMYLPRRRWAADALPIDSNLFRQLIPQTASNPTLHGEPHAPRPEFVTPDQSNCMSPL